MNKIEQSSKPDHFKPNFDCAEPDLCFDCFWNNEEQCMREILSQEEIEEILNLKVIKL